MFFCALVDRDRGPCSIHCDTKNTPHSEAKSPMGNEEPTPLASVKASRNREGCSKQPSPIGCYSIPFLLRFAVCYVLALCDMNNLNTWIRPSTTIISINNNITVVNSDDNTLFMLLISMFDCLINMIVESHLAPYVPTIDDRKPGYSILRK